MVPPAHRTEMRRVALQHSTSVSLEDQPNAAQRDSSGKSLLGRCHLSLRSASQSSLPFIRGSWTVSFVARRLHALLSISLPKLEPSHV